MRILFIGKRYYTNKDAFTERFGRIYQLPMQWHAAGHAINLHMLDYHGSVEERSADDGFLVRSIPVRSARSLWHLWNDADNFKPDIVVASGDCFLGILGLRIARRARARFVFDVYDDYRTFGAYRFLLGYNAMALVSRKADLVMYASRAMAAKHAYASATFIAPNGVDAATFAPMASAEARSLLKLPPQCRFIGYFGSMEIAHGVTVLIDAVEQLRTRDPNLYLLACGKKNSDTDIGRECVLYRGVVPHTDIPAYLNACDVLALPYLRSTFLDAASSCKIAEYLFCRRPLVATRTPNFVTNFPEQAHQLEDLLTEPGDVDALANSIQRQLDDPLIVDPPRGMTWSEIAAGLISRFRALV